MLDFNHELIIIVNISREDRALLRSNLSARLMPEDGREHMLYHVLLSSCSSFGRKATNLLSWCRAPTKVKQVNDHPPVGHMSVLTVRWSLPDRAFQTKNGDMSALSGCTPDDSVANLLQVVTHVTV